MRQLGKQQPETAGLGFKTGGRSDASALEVGRAVLQTMHEQGEALAVARLEIDAAHGQVQEAAEALQKTRDDAHRLWQALRVAAEHIRSLQAEHADLGLTPEVEVAMQVLVECPYVGIDTDGDGTLVEDEDGAPLPWCPECTAGKHANCTRRVLVAVDDQDLMVPCGCDAGGHR